MSIGCSIIKSQRLRETHGFQNYEVNLIEIKSWSWQSTTTSILLGQQNDTQILNESKVIIFHLHLEIYHK